MFLEFMVATVCITGQGKGCSESTSAYYRQSKELQEVSKRLEDIGNDIAKKHQWVVYAATPICSVVAGQPAKFHIRDGAVLGINLKEESVFLQWNY
jgi:hypothetical protein